VQLVPAGRAAYTQVMPGMVEGLHMAERGHFPLLEG
jgi:hypothetical protein